MKGSIKFTKAIPSFIFGSAAISTSLLFSPTVLADFELCKELVTKLDGSWVGEASETVTVEEDNQSATLTCNWDLALSFYVSIDEIEGDQCIFKVSGFLDIEHHDLDATSSNSDVKATRYCSWSDSVAIKKQSLSVPFTPEKRGDSEFKLEFDFAYTRGTEFDITMYVLKHTEYELATLTPENRIVLEAGFLEKKPD